MRKLLAFALPLALLASACGYDNDGVRRGGDYSGAAGQAGTGQAGSGQTDADPNADNGCSSDGTPVQSTIDVDRKLSVDAGQGAGVFVEYSQGGHWQLRTACDSSDCAWDIVVTPETGSSIVNAVALDLEADDQLRRYPEDTNSYQLVATTSSDLDGFTFDSNPGAAVRVDALLDGACARKYLYWFGDGGLHRGSPTNPLDLIPSAE